MFIPLNLSQFHAPKHTPRRLRDYARVRPSTVTYFRRCLSQFGPNRHVSELCPDSINRFLGSKPGTPGYRRSLRRGLLALLWFAAERGCQILHGLDQSPRFASRAHQSARVAGGGVSPAMCGV